MTVLRARVDLCGKQVFYCTNMANRFSTIQYRCIFVQLDINTCIYWTTGGTSQGSVLLPVMSKVNAQLICIFICIPLNLPTVHSTI